MPMKRGLSTGDITNALSDENGGPFTNLKMYERGRKEVPITLLHDVIAGTGARVSDRQCKCKLR